MASLAEVDRDLDAVLVDAARLASVRAATRARLALADVDRELSALSNGARLERVASTVSDPGPRTEEVAIVSAAVAVEEAPPHEPLSLDLDSGETGLEEPDELPREATYAAVSMPVEADRVEADRPVEVEAPFPETRPASIVPPLAVDDPNVDLAALLGDSDPMREDEGAAPLSMGEIEPEPTMMFTAEDAARYSRPAPGLDDSLEGEESVELDLDEEVIEIDDEEQAAAAPKTAPPPPPRTAPPAPPGSRPPGPGFLGKILQRKS